MEKRSGASYIDIINAIARWQLTHDHGPTVRDIKQMLGYFGTGRLHDRLLALERVGVIRWPMDDDRGRRVDRGIELAIPLEKPVRIPIVGYLGKPADFVPGERYIEIWDGKVYKDGEECVVLFPNEG